MNRSQHSSAVFREWPRASRHQALRHDVRTQASYLPVLPALSALPFLPVL